MYIFINMDAGIRFIIRVVNRRAFISFIASFLLHFATCASAQTTEPVNEIPIILPEYKVTASRHDIDIEQWLYTAWDDIEIISCADMMLTNDTLFEMRKTLKALEVAAPGLRLQPILPFYIIMHQAGPTRRQLYAKGWKPELFGFATEQSGRQILSVQVDSDMGSPENRHKSPKAVGKYAARSYFFTRLDQYFPTLPRWFVMTIREITLYSSTGDDEIQRQIPNAFVMGVFTLSSKQWLNTAIGDELTVLIRGSRGTYIKSTDPELFKSEFYYQKGPPPESKRVRPMPMGRMFAGQYDDVIRTPGYPQNLWRLQCYTFWHYCCVREDAGALRQGYMKLVEKSADGPITEAVFRECMGMSFAEMENALFQYVGPERAKQGYNYLEVPFNDNDIPQEISLRKATQAEVARIKGECLAFQDKLDLARKTMLTVYDRKKADPRLCASLGILEYKAGDLEKARGLLAAAIQLKLPNPEVYRTLARIKLDDALGMTKKSKKPAPGKRLTPEQAAEIYELLRAIRQMRPLRVETYQLLEEMLSYIGAPPTPEQVAFVEEGKRWFPEGKNSTPFPRHLG